MTEEYQQFVHKQVSSLVFGLLPPNMIKKMAAAKIVTPELYDKEGYPVDGGLMDIRLGVIDPGLRCKTCGGKLKECIGHFGYIELARPIIHFKFVDIVYNLLRATCFDCGRGLMQQADIDKWTARLIKIEQDQGLEERRDKTKEILVELKKTQKCPHCKAQQPKVVFEKPTTFLENEKRISPIEIRTRLEKIPDQDLELLGMKQPFVRPEWMVLTVMPIPPVTMRPSITLETGERSEDDLTHKLGDIVRINQRLFENINAGAPEIIIEDLWDLLQYHVTTFFDNEVPQVPPARHRSGQPLKTITARIKSKEGRIRHNLAGKRTNFSARTVISPDPLIELNEVGVPNVVAMKLTVPERVTEWNKDYLLNYVKLGPTKYPGANYIVRPDGKKKKITDETKEQLLEEIQPGYLVERHLIDGDIAIFNRQPSLHKMSMMCHRIRVLPGKTFRLNPAVCHPYNADFDGDEMNLHVPQTEEARAEAETLMMVQTQLISPRYGLAIIGCTQDAVSGNYLLTKYGEYPRQDAIDLLFKIGADDTMMSRLPHKKTVTGREIFSALLPDEFSFSGTALDGTKVEIVNGQLVEGHMDLATLGGEGKGMMLRKFNKDYGGAKTLVLIGMLMKLGIFTLQKEGLTTALSDTDLPQETQDAIDEILVKANETVEDYIQKYRKGELEPLPGRNIKDTVELEIIKTLNRARNEIGKLAAKSVAPRGGSVVMINSGARGKSINLALIAACVGQQALRGKRIERGYTDRTLSSFKRNDLGTAAHGFVKQGYSQGMTPQEFFFMAMTGRDALMDTALRTPKSGYLYRRLANALQDLRVEYDHSVRDAAGRIVEFLYGDDGIDVSKSEKGKIDVTKIMEMAR
ncbi:DNA-directed RNA polymerase subunit A' [Candidatus Woesearchaeota archaeon]|nr:DNA-directed RNA polymerase subunit A' [Candidatus Woesearchaeota archaeon]